MRPEGAIFEPLGVLWVTLSSPGAPRRGRGEKVSRSSSLESAKSHSVETERQVLKFVFFPAFEKSPFCANRTLVFDENVGSGVLPFGPQVDQNPRKIEKKSLGGARCKALCARCCTRGASGPPPTMKTMVSCRRNHCFHSSPGGAEPPKMVADRYLLEHL